jgi:hypothetical protein
MEISEAEMTDQDQQTGTPNSITNVSGGVNLNAQRDVNIGGDVVGGIRLRSSFINLRKVRGRIRVCRCLTPLHSNGAGMPCTMALPDSS